MNQRFHSWTRKMNIDLSLQFRRSITASSTFREVLFCKERAQ
ncbi:hypothetical protein Patl1_14735 [Pistacia atlantica]|uniref:Uncharacterized protein n=1 Tax=Pistacia atlantica TaxID=434234 RepID=A0ACC1AU32_9ROSI|nr:hypothetical protein Patl1_14735 [Pistacia atlantica]